MRLPAIVFFPGLGEALRARFTAAHLVFADAPADLDHASRAADVAITYASLSTTTRFLLAGKPVLLLPSHLEESLMARRVAEMGAGILVAPEKPAPGLTPYCGCCSNRRISPPTRSLCAKIRGISAGGGGRQPHATHRGDCVPGRRLNCGPSFYKMVI